MKKIPAAVLLIAAALSTGCATHSKDTVAQEERASVDLQRAGAREASSAAQDRAEVARARSRCSGIFECLVVGLLEGSSSPSSSAPRR